MTGIMEGKVALVTGAAGGIGRAAAQIFAREGAKVIVADLQEDAANETVHTIVEAGGEATAIACDVTVESQVEDLVAACVDTYGRLDAAHNNAGINDVSGRSKIR